MYSGFGLKMCRAVPMSAIGFLARRSRDHAETSARSAEIAETQPICSRDQTAGAKERCQRCGERPPPHAAAPSPLGPGTAPRLPSAIQTHPSLLSTPAPPAATQVYEHVYATCRRLRGADGE